MARARRPYLPGAFFHLTARTQNREHWFAADIIKDSIVTYLADAADACDADVVAFSIMHNHLHVMLRQQRAQLSGFMQPLLRRCALLIQRTFGIDGHIFSRTFHHRVCVDAEDLRNCIGYVHRNPVKAGACFDPAEYPWCSHTGYLEDDFSLQGMTRPRLMTPIELYARSADSTTRADHRRDYLIYMDELQSASRAGVVRRPFPLHGDRYWVDLCTPSTTLAGRPSDARMDLRDVVLIGIRQLCPDLDITEVRAFRGARMIAIRTKLVERAGMAGHRGCDIARYLHMSEARVSHILKNQRIKNLHAAQGGTMR